MGIYTKDCGMPIPEVTVCSFIPPMYEEICTSPPQVAVDMPTPFDGVAGCGAPKCGDCWYHFDAEHPENNISGIPTPTNECARCEIKEEEVPYCGMCDFNGYPGILVYDEFGITSECTKCISVCGECPTDSGEDGILVNGVCKRCTGLDGLDGSFCGECPVWINEVRYDGQWRDGACKKCYSFCGECTKCLKPGIFVEAPCGGYTCKMCDVECGECLVCGYKDATPFKTLTGLNKENVAPTCGDNIPDMPGGTRATTTNSCNIPGILDDDCNCNPCDMSCSCVTCGKAVNNSDMDACGTGSSVPATLNPEDCSIRGCQHTCGECFVCDNRNRPGIWTENDPSCGCKCVPCEISCGMCTIKKYNSNNVLISEIKGILINNPLFGASGEPCSKCVACEVDPKEINLAHSDFECGGSNFCKTDDFLCPGTTNEHLPCIKAWVPYSVDNPSDWQTDSTAGYYACIPCGQCPPPTSNQNITCGDDQGECADIECPDGINYKKYIPIPIYDNDGKFLDYDCAMCSDCPSTPFPIGCGGNQGKCTDEKCPDGINYKKWIPIVVGEGASAYNDCLLCEDCPSGGATAEFQTQACGQGPDVDGIDITFSDNDGNQHTVFVATNGDACERYKKQTISYMTPEGCSRSLLVLVDENQIDSGAGTNSLQELIESSLRAATIEITCDADGTMTGKITPGIVPNGCSGNGVAGNYNTGTNNGSQTYNNFNNYV